MEKRFLVFIVLTMLVLTAHVFLQATFAPPLPPADEFAEVPPAAEETESPDTPEATPAEVVDPAPSTTASSVAEAGAPSVSAEPQIAPVVWNSLGSYDGTSGPLLVTVTSRGGALERIELVERTENGKLRYRDLENKSGYLGNLAFVAAAAGCRVQVVGAGTPAALAEPISGSEEAGLRAGDLLRQIGPAGSLIDATSPADVSDLLDETRPGDEIQLLVERDGESIEFKVTLGVRPFQIVRPEPLTAGESEQHPLSMLLSLTSVGGQMLPGESPQTAAWTVHSLEGPRPGIEFRLPVVLPGAETGSLELVKRFRLGDRVALGEDEDEATNSQQAPYHLDFDVAIRNTGGQQQTVQYALDGPNGLPLEGWWYSYKTHPVMFKSAGARDILIYRQGFGQQLIGCSAIYKQAADEDRNIEALFAQDDSEEDRDFRYLGVDTQYFLSALMPVSADRGAIFERAEPLAMGQLREKRLSRTTNVSFRLTSPELVLEPGAEYSESFRLFAGPKAPEVLASYGLEDAIYYGWFGAVSRPLSSVLHFFNRLVGNFGLAIVMLTILVRGCMFPLSRKAAKNAAMMQELAPEMKAIAEKYKNDMEKRARAQQDLFRRHNYNPLGGCWLMFLQLPIFIGLYRCLSVDIELRQAALIPGANWCSNLAGPDQLFYWGDVGFFLFAETGMLGPYFNILPLFTIALFLAHQQLFTPPATDEQTRLQLKMMKFMTLFIGIMFFKVASGLCLYFIASSLWGIAERKLLPKSNTGGAKKNEVPQVETKQRVVNRPAPNGNGGKGGGKARKRSKRR